MNENEWKPLSDATRGLVDKLRPKLSDYKGGLNPIFKDRKSSDQHWLQRRFFLAFGKTAISIMWVDDDNTCANQHLTYEDGSSPGEWHQYQDEKGYVWAIRCPARLPPEIKIRLEADIPPGHAANRVREARSNRQEQYRHLKVERVKQEDLE